MLKLVLLLLAAVAVSDITAFCNRNLLQDLTFQLSGNSLEWPDSSTKNIYIQTGRYVPKSVIMTRTQIHRDEAFVVMPRLKSGVPMTLGKVSLKKGNCATTIVPYPCWSLQEEGNCEALQSAVDLFLDSQVIIIAWF